MLRGNLRRFIHLALSFTLAFSPLASADAGRVRLILETEVEDIDSTRLAVDFGEMTFTELGRLPTKLQDHADILPAADKPLTVFVFVPASLAESDRVDFVAQVEAQMREANPHLRIQAQAVEIDSESSPAEDNQRIDRATEEIIHHEGEGIGVVAAALKNENNRTAAGLKAWGRDFKGSIAKYKNWIKSGYTKEKDERVGGWIGKARGMASAAVWFGFNKASWATVFQIPASFFLDWFFSKYERRVDNWKATHRAPGESLPLLGHVVRFYNERPLLKSWIIGNLIGFVAGNYFRFWSWMEDPARTSAPWSADALATYGGAWTIGNLAGAYGAQGPRILRKKGYISSRTEYYLYVSYGAMFQLGGWFYGLGWNSAVLGLTTAESVLKVGMYTYGRLKPFKEARAIALHPALAEREVNELLYRVGLEKSETKSPTNSDFAGIVTRLKEAQTVTWKQRVSAGIKKALGKCESLLGINSKD